MFKEEEQSCLYATLLPTHNVHTLGNLAKLPDARWQDPWPLCEATRQLYSYSYSHGVVYLNRYTSSPDPTSLVSIGGTCFEGAFAAFTEFVKTKKNFLLMCVPSSTKSYVFKLLDSLQLEISVEQTIHREPYYECDSNNDDFYKVEIPGLDNLLWHQTDWCEQIDATTSSNMQRCNQHLLKGASLHDHFPVKLSACGHCVHFACGHMVKQLIYHCPHKTVCHCMCAKGQTTINNTFIHFIPHNTLV